MRPSRRLKPAVVLLSFVVGAGAAAAQQSPAAGVVLAGRIVAADTGVALRRARVVVTMGGVEAQPVFTDDEGRFAVARLSDAPFTIAATKAGYAATSVRSALQRSAELRIVMPRGSAISGRVVDAQGVPAVGAAVVVHPLGAAAVAPGDRQAFSATTDDFGEYRIGGLPAGPYTVGPVGVPVPFPGLPPDSPVSLDTIERAIPRTETAVAGGGAPAPVVARARRQVELRTGDHVRGIGIVLPAQPTIEDMRREALARTRDNALVDAPALPADLLMCAGDGVMRGRALTAAGEPLASVSVRIANRPLLIQNGTTDSGGTFTFTCLQPGDYTFEAARPGYVPTAGGATYVTRIPVRAGETVDVPDIVLHHAAAAVGTVMDEHGEPIEGVSVRALQVRYARGRMTAVPVGTTRRTDDRGQFRIFGLAAGAYFVVAAVDASLQTGSGLGYPPLYYPGASAIDAALQVQVEPGIDVTGLNIVFRPSLAARVSGVAIDTNGEPVVGSVLLAVSHRSGAVAVDPIVLPIGPGGTFTIPNVPSGDYVVHAVATPRPGRSAEFGSEYVSVTDRSPEPLTIRTSTGGTLEGRLVVDGAGPNDVRSHSFALMTYPSDPDRTLFAGRGSGFVIGSDGSFYGVGLYGPRRIVLGSAPPGWYLKSVTLNGTDVTDSGFELRGADTVAGAEIVLSAAGASLEGRAVDARGEPVAASAVVLPVRRDYWTPHSRHLRYARTKDDGSFVITGLPPGDYWVAAVDVLETGPAGDAWQNPAVLERLAAGAERVTLGESEARSIVVSLKP